MTLFSDSRNHAGMPVPRCAALRRGGLPCGAPASSPDAEFCRHHERLIDLHGEQAIGEGCYPKRRRTTETEPVVVETSTITTNGAHSPAAKVTAEADGSVALLRCAVRAVRAVKR